MTTYYVRKPPNGNNANDGLSSSNAVATFSRVEDLCNDGDTIIIGGGDYSDQQLLPAIEEGDKYNNMIIIGDYDGSLTSDSGWVYVKNIVFGYGATLKWLWTKGRGAGTFAGVSISIGNLTFDPASTQTLYHIRTSPSLNEFDELEHWLINVDGDPTFETTAYLDTCWFTGRVRCYGVGYSYVRNCTFISRDGAQSYFGGPHGTGYIIEFTNCLFVSSPSVNPMISFGGVCPCNSTVYLDYNAYFTQGRAILYTPVNASTYSSAKAIRLAFFPDCGGGCGQPWEGYSHSIDFTGAWGNNPGLEDDECHLKEDSPCIDKGICEGLSHDIDNESRPFGEGCDIGCDEYYPAPSPDNFAFEPSQKEPILIRNTPYREPQLKWPCTHDCSGIQYTLGTCPRCLGKGYYYDIKFDAGGLVPQVWDETKLQQELEKITLTEYNPFHPEYGAGLKKRVGQVGVDELKVIIKSDLIDAVYNLMKYQKAEANKGVQNGNFSSRELIERLKKVEITELSATELHFALYVITVHGKELELTGKILV